MLTSYLIDDHVSVGEMRADTREKVMRWLYEPPDPEAADEWNAEQRAAQLQAQFDAMPDDSPEDEVVVVTGIGPIVDPMLGAD